MGDTPHKHDDIHKIEHFCGQQFDSLTAWIWPNISASSNNFVCSVNKNKNTYKTQIVHSFVNLSCSVHIKFLGDIYVWECERLNYLKRFPQLL